MPSVVGEITKGAAFDYIVAGNNVQVATTAQKGAASFSTDNFAVAAGAVTVKDGGIAVAEGGTGQTTAQAAIDTLTNVAAATNEHVLTKDTATGNAIFKAGGGGASLPVVDTTSIVEDPVDATKEMRIDVGAVATGTVRVLTMPNQDIDLTPGTGSFATEAEGNLAATALQNVVEDTTPQWGGQVDNNGQAIGDGTRELLAFVEDPAAVNHIEIENNASTLAPIIRSTGDDANVSLSIATKGTGTIQASANVNVTGNITLSGTVDGRDVATDGTKLDGIEALADVTDATNVNAAGAVMESDYDAQTILAATTDNMPLPLTVAEQRLLGRITGGNIDDLTVAQVRTLLGLNFVHRMTPYSFYVPGITAEMAQTGSSPHLNFSGTTGQYVFTHLHQVKGYNGGVLKLDICFSMATAEVSKAVVWKIQVFSIANGETLPVVNLVSSLDAVTPDSVTKSVSNSATIMDTATITLTANNTLTEGELYAMKIDRVPTDAADTHTGKAQLFKAVLYEV